MLKPGSILWLLRHEMRVTWRGWWDATRTRGWGRIAFYLFTAAWLLFAGYWAAQLFAAFPPKASFMSLIVISAIFATIGTLMLSQSLILISDTLYTRGDMDLLLASPLPAWRILIVRMAAIAINVAAFYLILNAAVFVFLPFFGGWDWMAFMPTLAALALFVTAIGIVLARGLFRIFGPKNTRTFAQILAALTGAAIFLIFQFGNLMLDRDEGAPRSSASAAFAQWLEDTEGKVDLTSPIFIPARAGLGEPAPLLIWLGVAVGLYVLSVWWFARRFSADAAAIAGAAAPARKRRDAPAREFRSGVTRALVRKEWRLLSRDPLILSQILLPLLYFAPVVFIMWRDLGEGGLTVTALATSAGALVFISSLLASGLVWLTVSAEDAPDLLEAAPVERSTVERAKAIAATAPVLAVLVIPTLAAVFVSPLGALWLLAGTFAAMLSTALIGIWHQAPGSRKEFRRRARNSLAANMGQFFVTLGWASATGLAVAGGWGVILAIIPALISLGLLLALHESRQKDPRGAAEMRALKRAEKKAKARAAA